MPVFLVHGTILATDFPGTNIGDTFTLTVTTDGFAGICTVANGHLISVTGNLDGTVYDITVTGGYPANPTFSPSIGLGGDGGSASGFLAAGGPFGDGLFTYNPTSWSIADESFGASGSFAPSGCPKNAQGV